MDARIYSYLHKLAAKSGVQEKPSIKLLIYKAAVWHHKSPEFTKRVEDYLVRLAETEPTPFLRPPKGFLDGKFPIGRNEWSGRFGLKDIERLSPAKITGRTQVGKSTLIGRQITEIIDKSSTPVLAFEPKNSLSGLIRDHRNLYVLKLNEIKFNPFAVSLHDKGRRKNWISDFWGIIAQTGSLLTGSKSFGLQVLDELLDELESKDRVPTIFDLRDKVLEVMSTVPASSQTYRYGERSLNRIDGLLFTFGDTFNCQKGFPVEEFLNPNSHIVLNWQGLDPDMAKSVSTMLLQAIYHRLLNRRNSQGIAVFIDEAEEFLGFNSYDRSKAGVPFISKLIERGKEIGFKALVFATHHTDLNPTIRENATSRFCFNLSSHKDVRRAAEDMGLDEDQTAVIEELEVGEIVAKIKGREWKEPFTAKVDPVPLPEVSGDEIKAHNEEFMEKINEEVVPRKEPSEEDEGMESSQDGLDLNPEEISLLTSIAKQPFLSQSNRGDRLGWGNNKMKRLSDQIRAKGLARKMELSTSGRGRPRTLMDLTNRALDYFKDNNVQTKQKRDQSVIHLFWVTKISEFLKKKDYDVRKEVQLEGVRIDLLAVDREGNRLAVEVETVSAKNSLSKLPDLQRQVETIVFVVDKKSLVKKFEEGIEERDINADSIEIRKAQDMELDV